MGQMGPLRNATWALSNLMRGKPQPAVGHVSAAVPTLAKLLMIADEEVIMDTCWALSYVTDGGDDRIDMAVGAGIVGLDELRRHSNTCWQGDSWCRPRPKAGLVNSTD